MKDRGAFVFRLAAAALGDRSVTAMLCGAGICGLTASKLDGGSGFSRKIDRN